MVHHARENPARGEPTMDLHPDHYAYVPSSGYAPGRAPFHYDEHSAFERGYDPTVRATFICRSEILVFTSYTVSLLIVNSLHMLWQDSLWGRTN